MSPSIVVRHIPHPYDSLIASMHPDGYNSTTSNRTEFPLSNGFFSLNSEHPSWTGITFLF